MSNLTPEQRAGLRQVAHASKYLHHFTGETVLALLDQLDQAESERDNAEKQLEIRANDPIARRIAIQTVDEVGTETAAGDTADTLAELLIEAERERDEARAEVERLQEVIAGSPEKGKRLASLIASSTRLVQIERDDARFRAESAEAKLAKIEELHRKGTIYSHEDSCLDESEYHRENNHHESTDIGEFYCDQMPEYDICIECSEQRDEHQEWPCPTIALIRDETGGADE